MSGSAHTAVKHELLVRYLDAWTPAAVHRHRAAVFIGWAGLDGALTALRVFGEFADILAEQPMTMLIPTTVSTADLPATAGVVVSAVETPAVKAKKGTSVFGWFDQRDLAEVSTVAGVAGAEVLVAAPAAEPLELGLPLTCRVELVDGAGAAELLVFGTAAEKSLERFKEELWALDEYAGIQFRDPADDEGGLSDISAVAHLGPLRRTLLRHLSAGDAMTVASLRSWTLHETVFRAGDATRAVQALLTAGSVTRDPPNGRLSADTLIKARTA